jgi:hypothetical protein
VLGKFVDTLEKIYPDSTLAPFSFASEVAKGTRAATRGGGLADIATDYVVDAVDELQGNTPDGQFQALYDLVRRDLM